jgi:hypothetical protein
MREHGEKRLKSFAEVMGEEVAETQKHLRAELEEARGALALARAQLAALKPEKRATPGDRPLRRERARMVTIDAITRTHQRLEALAGEELAAGAERLDLAVALVRRAARLCEADPIERTALAFNFVRHAQALDADVLTARGLQ